MKRILNIGTITSIIPVIVVISCGSTNKKRNVIQKYSWPSNFPKGPYYKTQTGSYTTDKKMANDYRMEFIPSIKTIKKPLSTQEKIIINKKEYTPQKNNQTIKWKGKNSNDYFSNDTILEKNIFKNKNGFKKYNWNNKNQLIIDEDYQSLSIDGKTIKPISSKYYQDHYKNLYKFNGKYFSSKQKILDYEFEVVDHTTLENKTTINIDNTSKMKSKTYNFIGKNKTNNGNKQYTLLEDNKYEYYVKENGFLYTIDNFLLKSFIGNANISGVNIERSIDKDVKTYILGKGVIILTYNKNELIININKNILSSKNESKLLSLKNNQLKYIENRKTLLNYYNSFKNTKLTEINLIHSNKLKYHASNNLKIKQLKWTNNKLATIGKATSIDEEITLTTVQEKNAYPEAFIKLKNKDKYYSSIKDIGYELKNTISYFNDNKIFWDGNKIDLTKTYWKPVKGKNGQTIKHVATKYINKIEHIYDDKNIKYKFNDNFYSSMEKVILGSGLYIESKLPNMVGEYDIIKLDGQILKVFNYKNIPSANLYLVKNKEYTTNYKEAYGYKEGKIPSPIPMPNPMEYSKISIDGKEYLRQKVA